MDVLERLPGKSLTLRGWGFIAAASVALLSAQVMGRRDLLYVGIFLLVLPLLSVLVVKALKPRFDVQRKFIPHTLPAGSTTRVQLRISAVGTVSGTTILEETLPSRFGAAPQYAFPGKQTDVSGSSTYQYRLEPSRRGLFPIGPVTAEFTDPFGLGRARHVLGPADNLIVTPTPVDLAASSLTGTRGIDGNSVTRRQSSPSNDDIMTREYRSGDPMRRVHWAATARHGELMVRQEESVSTPQATLIMDQRESNHDSGFLPALGSAAIRTGELRSSDSFEWCITFAVSIATHLLDSGFTLRFLDQHARPALLTSASAPWPEDEEFSGRAGLANLAEGLAALQTRAAPAHSGAGPTETYGRAGTKAPKRTKAFQRTDASPRAKLFQRTTARRRRGAGPNGSTSTTASAFGEKVLDRLARQSLRGPLIALLGRTTPAEARRLAPASDFGSAALAVLVVDRPRDFSEAVEILQHSGWHAVAVTPQSALAAVWTYLDSPDSVANSKPGPGPENMRAQGARP